MNDPTRSYVPNPEKPPASRLAALVLILAGGLVLALVALGIVFLGHEIQYAGRIYPGVSVAGYDLSGLSPEEASELLAGKLEYPQTGKVAFQDHQSIWVATPLELGLFLDAETSAYQAYRLGREGGIVKRLKNQFHAWYTGVDLAPYLIYNEPSAQEYLTRIAADIDRPMIEAHMGLNGVEVDVRSGQVGRLMDVQETLQQLDLQLASLTDGIIPVVVHETPPVILDVDQQATIARNILKEPLTLNVEDPREGDPGPWTFDPPALATMLAIERVGTGEGEQYQVGLNTEDMRAFLEGLAAELEVNPVNARFIFNDETRELELIQNAVIGRKLLVGETLDQINASLRAGEHSVPLVFETQEPQVKDNARAEDLGITELVNAETSYFYGSSGSRIQNIQAASSRFHGLLVAPGETFSMAQALGDVSLDNGYAEALIIYGNRTIKGVGGGVCQVSTTLFRNVFFSGFPVDERHQHAYRVYYYELTAGNRHDPSLAGLDATVYVPLVDFKFTNDTPYWLLMETYVDAAGRSLTWKFYSTSDNRGVEWSTTGLQNRVDPPEPLYQENPDLEKGEIKQVDWAVEGADVTVTRTVARNGEVYLHDNFTTHYVPWRAIFEYGPGTEGVPTPEPEGEPAG